MTCVTLLWMLYSVISSLILPLGAGAGAVALLTSCKKAKTVTNATNTTTPTITPGTPTVGQP